MLSLSPTPGDAREHWRLRCGFPGLVDSAADTHTQDSSFAQMCPASEKDVNTFRGTLLGVEDELIDALINVAYSNPLANQEEAGSSTGHYLHLPPTRETWKRPPLGLGEDSIDTVATPSGNSLDDSARDQAYGAHDCDGFERYRSDCSNTTSATVWNPWEFGIHTDGMKDHTDGRDTISDRKADVIRAPTHIDSARTDCERVKTSSQVTSPSTRKLRQPDTARSEDIVIDSILLDGPANVSLLSSWNLQDWQTDMINLLAV